MDDRSIEFFFTGLPEFRGESEPDRSLYCDKRLAIDLSGVRQQIWRLRGEEVGDPLLTDHLPTDGTTTLLRRWRQIVPRRA